MGVSWFLNTQKRGFSRLQLTVDTNVRGSTQIQAGCFPSAIVTDQCIFRSEEATVDPTRVTPSRWWTPELPVESCPLSLLVLWSMLLLSFLMQTFHDELCAW